jgi:hypothetical protein
MTGEPGVEEKCSPAHPHTHQDQGGRPRLRCGGLEPVIRHDVSSEAQRQFLHTFNQDQNQSLFNKLRGLFQ